MEYNAGIDASLESSCICVLDGNGRIVREARPAASPRFRTLGLMMTRIGLETGPLSQWLYRRMRKAGLAV